MNIFSHYTHRENHVTNILMNLFSLNESQLLKRFANRFLPQVDHLEFGTPKYLLFTESADVDSKEFEYAVTIAPFPRKVIEGELKPNPASIPDAWVIGDNVLFQFELKVTGSIDEAQYASHRSKLSAGHREIEILWKEMVVFLRQSQPDSTISYLIEQFADVIMNFESPKPSSGMPKQIFSQRRANPGEPYFVLTGNARIPYKIEFSSPGESPILLTKGISGPQPARKWINNYILRSNNPSAYITEDNAVIDHCINPDKTEQKWNRWYLGAH